MVSLNAKVNFTRVVNYDDPEYVPCGIPNYPLRYRGSNHEGLDGAGGDASPGGSRWTDVWGVGWHKELPDVMGLPEHNPLADITKVDKFRFPDPRDPRISSSIHEDQCEFDRQGLFLAGVHRDTLFEQAYMLVGMENLFVAFHEEPNAVRALLHRITDFHLGLAEQYVARGVEWVHMGDDLGRQTGPLFGRATLEELFVPEYRRLLGYYAGRGVRVNFHSCGCVESILDVFVDLGVSLLNPVQASANDLSSVRARVDRRMAIMGAVPSHIVYEGPPERIRSDVKAKISLLAPGGGYVCAPDQGLPFPEENLAAFHAAVGEFGHYPLLDPEHQ